MYYFYSFLLLCYLIPCFSAAQSKSHLHYQKRATTIIAKPELNSFVQKVYCQGMHPAQQKEVISLYQGELDQIKQFKAFYTNAKGKKKQLKKKQISWSDALDKAFYSGWQKLSFFFEPQGQPFPFVYHYQKQTQDLMFLSVIALPEHRATDTFYYEVQVPKGYRLSYQLDSLAKEVFLVDRKQSPTGNRYIFQSYQSLRHKLAEKSVPNIRLMVCPEAQDPADYLNDWYTRLVAPHSQLQAASIQELQSAIPAAASPRETMQAIFNFVKAKISYIDFENGIGAVQPRDVNQVLQHKQGDCKDMSNLLCQALRHLGFEAYLALSATLAHPYDFDFPSLASADHVICVVRWEDEWLFLDATEDYGIFGWPSRQIQDKHIFLINQAEGQILHVPKVAAIDNKVVNKLELRQRDQHLQGEVQYHYHGLSQIDLQFLQNYTDKQKVMRYLKQALEQQFSNTQLSNFQLHNNAQTTQIHFQCEVKKMFTQVGARSYLSLSFLPPPHSFPTTLPEGEPFATYESQHRRLSLTLELEEAVQLKDFPPVDYAADGLRFQLSVQQTGATEIQLDYLYENEHVLLDDQLIESYNFVNQLIQESLQKSIIYERVP